MAQGVLSSDDDPSHLDEIYTPPDQLHFWSYKFGINLLEDAIIKTLDTSNSELILHPKNDKSVTVKSNSNSIFIGEHFFW